MIVAAHQPNYLPWPGYFHKILKSDLFIILDHVEFSKRGFINRNRVKGIRGALWLTVPVNAGVHTSINEVLIDNSKDWRRKHAHTLKSSYGKTPYFHEIYPLFEEIYDKEWTHLVDLNVEIIRRISEMLHIETPFQFSSGMNPQGKKMEMIIDICKKAGATVYFSGKGAKKYQDENEFEKNGIKLIYQNIELPEYPQRFGKFVPNLSIVDMLFNIGVKETKRVLEGI